MTTTGAFYTEEQKVTFIHKAQECGITKAMRVLGFPASKATAYQWLRTYGLQTEAMSIRTKAKEREQQYSDAEQLEVLSSLLDAIYFQLENPKLLKAHDIQKLSSAAETVISSMRLIDNKPSSITQRMDQVDGEIQQLIAQYRKEGQVRGPNQSNSHLIRASEDTES